MTGKSQCFVENLKRIEYLTSRRISKDREKSNVWDGEESQSSSSSSTVRCPYRTGKHVRTQLICAYALLANRGDSLGFGSLTKIH